MAELLQRGQLAKDGIALGGRLGRKIGFIKRAVDDRSRRYYNFLCLRDCGQSCKQKCANKIWEYMPHVVLLIGQNYIGDLAQDATAGISGWTIATAAEWGVHRRWHLGAA
jgi:hypothetical protein